MDSFDTDGKTNLKTLEGDIEVFVDLLEDIGVLEIQLNESKTFGTYSNLFECISSEERIQEDCTVRSNLIRCDFYENENTIHLKVIYILESQGDELLDREVYWFDSDGNDLPSENSDWTDILENMDIFTDEE